MDRMLSKRQKGIMWVFFGVFVLYSITLVFPFFWMFLSSLKTNVEFFQDIWALPDNWLFVNYLNALTENVKGYSFLEMVGNSLILVFTCTIVSLICCSTASYVVAKYKFFGRNLVYSITLMLIIVPSISSLPATYKLITSMGLLNKFSALIIMSTSGFGMHFLLLYSFFSSISWHYAEAAMIDGANDFQVFLRVMLPQAKPILIALCILKSIAIWNDYFSVYMYLPDKMTLAVGLKVYVDSMQSAANYPMLFTMMILSILPVLVVFSIFSKTIMQYTVSGGIKG